MEKEKNKKSSKKQNNSKNKNNALKKDDKVSKKKVTEAEIEEIIEDEVELEEEIQLEEEEVQEDIEDDDEEYNEDLDDEEVDDVIEDEEEYNEDLDNEEDDLDDEIVITEIKKERPEKKKEKKEKFEKKEKKVEVKEEKKNTSKEKIEKIEKIAKEKKKKTTNKNNKLNNIITLFDKYHSTIYSFVGGVLVTTFVVFMIWPDRIATLKNGEQPVVKVGKETYTANELYENMKDFYSVSLLLDDIDNDLLTKLYPEDDEMLEEVKSNAEYYFNTYKQYGYTEEQFLKENGFSSYDAFLEYLKLDHRRNKYLDEYVEDSLTDEEIKKYYDDNVFGDINTQHVLVEVKSDSDGEDSTKLSDEDAKKLAEEIITKLNDGTSWEQIQKDYKDKITYEDLSYQSWDASLEESFMTALKDMEDNSYSEEPVKTSYGYHVIYRLDQKKTPTLKKSKEKIVNNMVADKKAEDSNLLYKSLISLREEKNITFSDTVMKDKYETYCKQYK